jgi:hypothetical protein
MKRALVSLIVFITMIFSTSAETITIFDSNATITDGNDYETVVIKGDNTVVTMTGGSALIVKTMDSSTFNMLDGYIDDGIFAYNSSKINLFGGLIGDYFYCFGTSTVNIDADVCISEVAACGQSNIALSDNNSISKIQTRDESRLKITECSIPTAIFSGNSTVEVNCGTFTEISAINYSYVEIDGGAIWKLYPLNHSSVKINGGTINNLPLKDYSHIEVNSGTIVQLYTLYNSGSPKIIINGGEISGLGIDYGELWINGGYIEELGSNFLSSEPEFQPKIYIVGYDLVAEPYGGFIDEGQVSGYWNDGSPFSISLVFDETYGIISLYDGVIPPGCLNKPSSDISGDCKVNFTDLSILSSEWLDCGLNPNNACWE